MIIKGRFQVLKGYANNHVTIGFGSYGQVKLAKDLENGEVVAVKVINKIAKNQVMMHYGLSHPKIIKLLDVHIDTQKEITYMILEYAQGGTLYDKIKMSTVSKNQIKKYFKDVCQGLSYLHSQNIMHRDIKPENILLTKDNQAKLCDFGFAAILGQRKTLCGTYEYMSPQMIQNRPYDYKIDIWALGILLFQLLSGHAPFKGDRPEEVLEQMKTKIYFCQRFGTYNQDINIIKTILRVTPHKRPTIEDILQNPYFKIDEKAEKEELTTRSTTNTEDSKQKSATYQYLSQSCNPKKMGELQKLLEKQQTKEHQKQTYPPFYVPKNVNKFGTGIPVPVNQTKEGKSHSPMHSSKFPQNPQMTGQTSNNGQFPQYRPVTQMGQQNMMNKSFNTPQMKGQTNQGEGQQGSGIHQHSQNRTMTGFSGGFGRFS